MFPSFLMPPWSDLGAGMANHIWQSTLLMIFAGALTLLFTRNSAVIRYRLWLIASVKFLVPFSVFVALGGLLQWHPVHPVTPSEVPVVVRQISQPFTPSPVAIPAPSIAKATPVASPSVGIVFASVWIAGAAIVLLVWFVRWIQLVRIVRRAEPLEGSIPWIAFHSASPRVRILSSHVVLEPGIFGIVRPALLIPENIALNLSNSQLQAVIAHEMFHVRGRDNLAAAIHTVVQALFWFHPLVWWLGSRLLAERERACDEAVLQSGHDPADYAEGILKVCKSNLMMPPCVAGVSGSNLKKRIEVIMENRRTRGLTHAKKLLLTVAGAGIVIVPVFAGMMSAAESPIAAVREMQLPVIESTTSAALPVLLQAPAPSARQTPTVPAVQAAPQTSSIRVQRLPVIEQATIAGLPVHSQTPSTTLSQTQVQELPTVGNNVLNLLSVLPAFRLSPSPQQIPAPPATQAANGQQKWLDGVSIIISDAEKRAFQQLTNDQQRQGFITNFWLARDPTPGTPANEFKEEYDGRLAYANEHFTTQSGIPGSQTDRGKMHILNGPPDEIVSHPSGGTYYRPGDQGGGFTSTLPFETWRYRRLDGKGENLIYRFVDRKSNGEYTLEYDPGEKTK